MTAAVKMSERFGLLHSNNRKSVVNSFGDLVLPIPESEFGRSVECRVQLVPERSYAEALLFSRRLFSMG